MHYAKIPRKPEGPPLSLLAHTPTLSRPFFVISRLSSLSMHLIPFVPFTLLALLSASVSATIQFAPSLVSVSVIIVIIYFSAQYFIISLLLGFFYLLKRGSLDRKRPKRSLRPRTFTRPDHGSLFLYYFNCALLEGRGSSGQLPERAVGGWNHLYGKVILD